MTTMNIDANEIINQIMKTGNMNSTMTLKDGNVIKYNCKTLDNGSIICEGEYIGGIVKDNSTNTWSTTDISQIVSMPRFGKNMSLMKTQTARLQPVEIFYNNPYTTCVFSDGDRITVKAHDEEFCEEHGVAMCIVKKIYGERGKFLKAVENGKNINKEFVANKKAEEKKKKLKRIAAEQAAAKKKKAIHGTE